MTRTDEWRIYVLALECERFAGYAVRAAKYGWMELAAQCRTRAVGRAHEAMRISVEARS